MKCRTSQAARLWRHAGALHIVPSERITVLTVQCTHGAACIRYSVHTAQRKHGPTYTRYSVHTVYGDDWVHKRYELITDQFRTLSTQCTSYAQYAVYKVRTIRSVHRTHSTQCTP